MLPRENPPRDECDPNICRPAYVVASNPCPCCTNVSQGEVATSPSPEDPGPTDPGVFPETPDCLQMVYFSNPSETAQEFNYSDNLEKYEAGNGAVIDYIEGLGWRMTTPVGFYDLESLSPVGTFSAANGSVISTVLCTDYVDPSSPELMCIQMAYRDDTLIPIDQFTRVGDVYSSVEGGGGAVQYIEGIWRYQVGADIYLGSSRFGEVLGLYLNDAEDCVLFKECTEIPANPALPVCVQVVFADGLDIANPSPDPNDVIPAPDPPIAYNARIDYPLGAFNYNGSIWTPVDPLQGELLYFNGTWQIITEGRLFVGPTNEFDPLGIYEGPSGKCLLVKDCG